MRAYIINTINKDNTNTAISRTIIEITPKGRLIFFALCLELCSSWIAYVACHEQESHRGVSRILNFMSAGQIIATY